MTLQNIISSNTDTEKSINIYHNHKINRNGSICARCINEDN